MRRLELFGEAAIALCGKLARRGEASANIAASEASVERGRLDAAREEIIK